MALRIALREGFNPFLVRASVYWQQGVLQVEATLTLFQSLLSQGISLLAAATLYRETASLAGFQSLLSQGISLLEEQIWMQRSTRTSTFQSLLSQGISLLAVKARAKEALLALPVSIPS